MAHIAFPNRTAISAAGIALCTLAAVTVLSAQTNQTPTGTNKQAASGAATATAAKQSFDDLEFKGFSRYDSKTNSTVGHNFIYTRGDSVTKGDNGRYKEVDTKTHEGILDADGNLVFDDPQHHATCNKAHIDRIAKLAVFTENVVLVLKPEKEGNAAAPPPNGAQPAPATSANGAPDAQPENGAASDTRGQKKHGATVYCDRMEDQYRKKYIKLFGHLIFKQKYVDEKGNPVERELTAEHAEYNGKTEQMILFGQVDGHNSKGEEIHFPNGVTVGTKEGEETLEGTGGHFKFLSQDDNEEDNAGTDANDNAKANADNKANDATKDKNGAAPAGKGKP